MDSLDEEVRAPYTRIKEELQEDYGEDYSLKIIFTMLTAEHLHRAWNMTQLTSNVLDGLVNRFNLRMTWEPGVIRLKFRIQDGRFERHRIVPYDYDSEYQDK